MGNVTRGVRQPAPPGSISAIMGQFAAVPRHIIRVCEGRPEVLAFYVTLAAYADVDTRVAKPPQAQIARAMGCTTRTVRRHVQAARAMGLVEVEALLSAGRKVGNAYRLAYTREQIETNRAAVENPVDKWENPAPTEGTLSAPEDVIGDLRVGHERPFNYSDQVQTNNQTARFSRGDAREPEATVENIIVNLAERFTDE